MRARVARKVLAKSVNPEKDTVTGNGRTLARALARYRKKERQYRGHWTSTPRAWRWAFQLRALALIRGIPPGRRAWLGAHYAAENAYYASRHVGRLTPEERRLAESLGKSMHAQRDRLRRVYNPEFISRKLPPR